MSAHRSRWAPQAEESGFVLGSKQLHSFFLMFSFQAIDNDEEDTPNSELGFKIVPGLYSNNFTINQTSGEMYSIEPLDREAVDSEDGQLVVTVEVYDHGVPQLSTMVNVTITVAVSTGHSQTGCRGGTVSPRATVGAGSSCPCSCPLLHARPLAW